MREQQRVAQFWIVERPGIEELMMALRWGTHLKHRTRINITVRKGQFKLQLDGLQVVGIAVSEADRNRYDVTVISHEDVTVWSDETTRPHKREVMPKGVRFMLHIESARDRRVEELAALPLHEKS